VSSESKETAIPKTDPKRATSEAPFVNSLGMKFVPVWITGGPTGGQQLLFSVWDTRVEDYAVYAKANNADDAWQKQERLGVPVGREPNMPVVGVTWDEAQAFCAWLTEKETAAGRLPKGMKYRLPSDEEWSWAVSLPPEVGATPAEKSGKNRVDFPWGKEFPPTRLVGNYADEMFHGKFPKEVLDPSKDHPWVEGYDDGYAASSPVGSYPANEFGLYDMGGNVWQWCGDWYDARQKTHLLRGASWGNALPGFLLSSFRAPSLPERRDACYGFRCVLAVSEEKPASGGEGVGREKADAAAPSQ
jgi:formylglycine-generating enzyme required for sulfatase activity